jgi:ribosomal-protein-alanine N-acetyltransferase
VTSDGRSGAEDLGRVEPLPFSALSAVDRLAARCFDNAWERAAFATFLAAKDARNRGLFGDDGTLRGFAITLFAAGNLDVVTVAVAPEWRRRGIARALLDALRAEGDVESSTLEVRVDNVAARRLYEAMGYVAVGTRKRYYEGRVDATLMRWDRPRASVTR